MTSWYTTFLPQKSAEAASTTPPSPQSTFARLVEDSRPHLPPSGPELFEARRRLWTTPANASPRPQRPPSPSRTRLHELLHTPGALESDQVWHAGLGRVWKGLVSGGRLRSFLPLPLVNKILYAGWVRDGTWPAGEEVPDEDNFFGTTAPPAPDDMTSGAITDDSASASVREGTPMFPGGWPAQGHNPSDTSPSPAGSR
ncbi:hypothetical protein PENSPDRAFT_689662 [Peniophora sp. CONT]|nr:hypothetical protein PENSPDRAFT_689662 [Peniophora sp. CONT]